jgi:hypothetical protein
VAAQASGASGTCVANPLGAQLGFVKYTLTPQGTVLANGYTDAACTTATLATPFNVTFGECNGLIYGDGISFSFRIDRPGEREYPLRST